MKKKELIESIIATGSNHFTRAEVISYLENVEEQSFPNYYVNKRELEEIISNKVDQYNSSTISCLVTIGKSKVETPYTFLTRDFIRIENESLILKNEDRRIRVSLDIIKSILVQMNFKE